MERKLISSDSPWEKIAGYSRAVRIGNTILVSGTTAFGPDGKLVGAGNAEAQTLRILENISRALAEAGGSLKDVVRVRAFVVRREDMDIVARTMGKAFGAVLPANTTVGAAWLADPEMLVEIEAEAVVENAP